MIELGIVRRYEPVLCRSIQARLRRLRLCRLLDAADVCQTVLARFFVRASWGRFELDTPQLLDQLLFTMARHELANLARKHRAARRDHRRTEGPPRGSGRTGRPRRLSESSGRPTRAAVRGAPAPVAR